MTATGGSKPAAPSPAWAPILESIASFAELSPFGIAVTTGKALTVLYLNPAFRLLTNTNSQPIVGSSFSDAFPGLRDWVEQLRAGFQGTSVEDQPHNGDDQERNSFPEKSVTSSIIDAAGQELTLVSWPIRSAVRGDPGLVVLILPVENGLQPPGGWRGQSHSDEDRQLREVNQRLVVAALREQELSERAEASSAAKTAFVAAMSHELRTPLNAIIGYASLLDEGIWGPVVEQQHEHLTRLKMSATHLLGLVDEVLTLARADANLETIDLETVEVGSLLDDAATLTMPMATNKNLAFSVLSQTHGRSIETDRRKVLQILVNLIGNAIKFTDSGEIVLSASADAHGNEVRFAVKDTGIGISPDNLEHVFEAFWQVEQGPTRRAGGTGLGLQLSRRMALLLGGDLTVDTAVGKGSTFTLRIPVHRTRMPG